MQLIEDIDQFARLLASIKVSGKNRSLSPFEVATYIQRMEREGLKIQEISERLSIEQEMIKQFLSLTKIPETRRNTIVWGTSTDVGVSFSTAVRIARLDVKTDKGNDMHMLMDLAMKHKLNKKEMGNIITLRRNGSLPIKDCIEKIMNIRPEIEHNYMYVITVNSETMTELKNLSESKNLELPTCLKNILSPQLTEKNILAIVVKDLKIVISLNVDGSKIFSKILYKNKLTIGNSMHYFLRNTNRN